MMASTNSHFSEVEKMMAVTMDDIQKHLAEKPFAQRCIIELGPGE